MGPAPTEATARLAATADIFLDSAWLELRQDGPEHLGWWLVTGPEAAPLSVTAAVAAAPRGLGHEVLLDTVRVLEAAARHRDRPDLDSPAWRVAVARLRESVRLARATGMDATEAGPLVRALGV